MSGYRFTRQAQEDLRRIVARIRGESGNDRARQFRAQVTRAARRLAEFPRTGHPRPDLTNKETLFWVVYSHLIAYELQPESIVILHVAHGASDPTDLRDRVGEPVLLERAAG